MTEFDHLFKLLNVALKNAAIVLKADVPEKLVQYILLLHKWNQTYNLTSIRNPEAMIQRHLVESLLLIPYLEGERILDIGSGGGLPGIPLALALATKKFVLLDSNGKKTRFLSHVIHTLQMRNVEVVQQRVENYHPVKCFNSIVTRAFASLSEFITVAKNLCCSKGCFLAMKGVYPTKELDAISGEFSPIVYDLAVPGLNAKRHLVVIKKE